MNDILVTYFSATGKTKKLAEQISDTYNLDIYEIKPKEEYTKKDLNWINPFSRTSKEHRNKEFLPPLANTHAIITEYKKIVLCFPIWWYTSPNIINTFLDSYDFSHKEIIIFATSGSSGLGDTAEKLKKHVDRTCTIIEGKVNPTLDEIKAVMEEVIK